MVRCSFAASLAAVLLVTAGCTSSRERRGRGGDAGLTWIDTGMPDGGRVDAPGTDGGPAEGMTCPDGVCPDGYSCVPWGSEGEPLCDVCPDGAPRPTCIRQAGSCAGDPGGGSALTYVFHVLAVGQADPAGDPNIVPGFDLDGRESADDDQYGCFHPDFTSPPPDSEPGVDNQMGPILASVGSSLDIEGSIAESIASGDLLVLLTVEGIDSFADDPCVHVSIEMGTLDGTGATAPVLDGTGRLAPGQTFNVEMASVGRAETTGEIVAGRLNAGPVDFALGLSLDPTMAPLLLDLRRSRLRADLAEAGVSAGVLGGALDVDTTVAALVAVAPDEIPESLARSILEGQADLDPAYDPAIGGLACESVSMGLVFDGVPAVRGEVVP